MRVLILTVGLLLLAALAGLSMVRAEEAPPADPPPTTEPATLPEDDTPADTAVADEPAEEDTGDEATEVPEGVRRQRPRTEEQEREYKQRKTREDIYLSFPVPIGPAAGVAEYYNPANWLNTEIPRDLCRYIVQDQTGAVVGSLTVDISRETDPFLGESIHIRQRREFDPPSHLDLWLNVDTLKPRTKEVRTNPGPAAGSENQSGAGNQEVIQLYRDSQLLHVDYLFDRVTVYHEAAGISVRRAMRQMPFSYDIDALPLLVRQLDFLDPDWPFEAAVCDPRNERNLPFAIEQPRKVENLMSAEPRTYRVYELLVKLGDRRLTYWVERLAPHRLVKYTDGEYTYTLTEYLERE